MNPELHHEAREPRGRGGIAETHHPSKRWMDRCRWRDEVLLYVLGDLFVTAESGEYIDESKEVYFELSLPHRPPHEEVVERLRRERGDLSIGEVREDLRSKLFNAALEGWVE